MPPPQRMAEDTAGPDGMPTVLEQQAGIDWITLITESRQDADAVREIAHDAARRLSSTGSDTRPWRWMGYEGWHTASVRLGSRSGKVCLQVTGREADTIMIPLRSSVGRLTRLDAQVTTRLSASHPLFGYSSISSATECPNRRTQCRPRIGSSSDSGGLFIGTVGARTDPRYLRVYDKGVETRTYPRGVLWRHELEAKAGLAEVLWADLKREPDVRAWCYATVEAQWKSSGCWWCLPASSAPRPALRAPEKPVPGAVSLAAWLRSSVRPTIPRLLTVYSVAEVLEMLGMSDIAEPTTRSDDDAGR
jgi:hypothetical protein